MTSAVVLLMISTIAGCSLTSPTSPNDPSNLTGQNGNTNFNFTGTVVLTLSSNSLVGDDLSTIVVTADVRDSSGNPISNLTSVTFSANLGGFDQGDPTQPAVSAVTANTFNGIAQALYRSASSGNAIITASVGTVSDSENVEVEPAPQAGAIQLYFLVGGQQLTTTTGAASQASPFIRELNAVVIDPLTGGFQQGVEVRFSIIDDSTTGSGIGPARFVGPSTSFTDQFGVAIAQIRAVGIGDLTVIAQMIDSNTGEVAGTSNQVIAITSAAFIATLAFDNGTAAENCLGVFPCLKNFTVNVQNTLLEPQPGVTVRFTITDDTSSGASLSSSNAVTDANGNAPNTISVPDNVGAPSVVTIIAEVIDSQNNVLATSNAIIVTGS